MSYHEIGRDQLWLIKCKDCDFSGESSTPGGAENIACEHINKEDNEYGYPNYSHILTLNQSTIIGRNV